MLGDERGARDHGLRVEPVVCHDAGRLGLERGAHAVAAPALLLAVLQKLPM